MTVLGAKINSSTDSPYPDCSAFLNWDKDDEELESEHEKAVVFRSLVATLKLQPVLDDSLEEKAVILLKSVNLDDDTLDAYLSSVASSTDDSVTDFVQSIVVLISSPNQAMTTAAMQILDDLIFWCSTHVRLALVKADLIPQLIHTLNPLSLSFEETVDIHVHLSIFIQSFLRLQTQDGLDSLGIKDENEKQTVHETVFRQVLSPSEEYISHLCANRYSIIDGGESENYLILVAHLLQICPYYQPTLEFVLHMPVVLTIPNCLTFFEHEYSIWLFLAQMNNVQREWNKERGRERQLWKIMSRKLRMEGFEDVVEEKLRNDKNERKGGLIVYYSIMWINLRGMNLPEQD
ncbi:hypothetical protein BLNAU_21039 [Blattamonas nauphoetae]|uniref:Uncharacterized protein n=1 Tax=Blattamonas nauphoetae TaxID=2049346 RepID=A0ABQ9WX27_9EUKA|nr:hypothetical protein BLNAU_21039 [Blattamonas nauphoetae]